MSRLTCRLCGGTRVHKKFDVAFPGGKKGSFPVYECAACKFQFRDIPEKEAYSFYGEDYYRGKAAFSYIDERKNEPASRAVWKARVKRLAAKDQSKVSAGKSFLDVGCSFGGLMQVAKEAGYEPFGAEVSRYSGDYARKRFGEKNVFIGNIENIRLPRDRFSVVTMIEVIEHLFRPGTALRKLHSSMKKGGVLLVQTADMSGLQAVMAGPKYHYYLPGHLSCFTRKNLENALRNAGFSRLKFYGGVEFGLLPKLVKSAATFRKASDYLKWFRIAFYHILSKVRIGGRGMTSSMVVLAWK